MKPLERLSRIGTTLLNTMAVSEHDVTGGGTVGEHASDVHLDVQYYRSRYADLAGLSDDELREHFRRHGSREGRHASSEHELRSRVQSNATTKGTDPDEFDPDLYLALHPDLVAHGIRSAREAAAHYERFGAAEGRVATVRAWFRQEALDLSLLPPGFSLATALRVNDALGIHLSAAQVLACLRGRPHTKIWLSQTEASNAADYLHLARHQLAKRELVSARQLLHASLSFARTEEAVELLANTLLEEGNFAGALALYDSLLAKHDQSRWAYLNSALCLEKLDRREEAIERMGRGLLAFPDFTLQVDRLDELVDRCWARDEDLSLAFAEAQLRGPLVAHLERLTSAIHRAYLAAFGCQELPALEPVLDARRILLVGDYHVPQCIRYRIDQKVEQLATQGRVITAIDWRDVASRYEDVCTHDVVIFYRVPAVPSVIKCMAQVNAAGRLSVYEIDDLLFDPAYPPPIETFGGYVSLDTHRGLTHGMALMRSAARLCRVGLASTRPLAAELAALVTGGRALVHRNGLDRHHGFASGSPEAKGTVDIFYGSGTQAHNEDFIVQALPALERALRRHPHVRLVVVGYLALPATFVEQFGAQLRQIPLLKSVEAYSSVLQHADINIAVLHDDRITGCKSELKWTEAACFSIPSVLSATDNYRDVVRNDVDGVLVAGPQEWSEALETLIRDEPLRRRMGAAAHERVRTEYSATRLGSQLVADLEALLTELGSQPAADGGRVRSALPGARQKVAVVNVFFPPQAIGGATRVVADNVRSLRSRYADRFDISVFTADVEHRRPHQLCVTRHEGVRTYRVTTPWRENMDWHATDERVGALFRRYLEHEQPDVVHFHCVQRLSASVVDVTRELKIPYLVTAHDAWWISDFQFLVDQENVVYPEGHPDPFDLPTLPSGVSRAESLSRRAHLKGLLRGAAAVTSVSAAFGEIYRKNGVPGVRTVSNGVSPEFTSAAGRATRTGPLVCALLGGMSDHKGYLMLERVARSLPTRNIEWLVVDHSKAAGYVQRASWGGSDVTFIGRCPQADMPDLYERIDVVFAPSRWPESYGLVTREALASGCWVVASSLGGIGEDVREGLDGYVIDPTEDALRLVIAKIDSDPQRHRMPAGRPSLRTSDQQLDELVSLYVDVMHGG